FAPTKLFRSRLDSFSISTTDDFHLGREAIRKEHRKCTISITMGFPHKFITNHTDINRIHLYHPFLKIYMQGLTMMLFLICSSYNKSLYRSSVNKMSLVCTTL